MPHTFKRTQLFCNEGEAGALECDLPAHFGNIANLPGRSANRLPVPDNQEVFLDLEKDGTITTIIFDLTERVGGPGSSPEIDGAALTTHLEDMVDEADLGSVKVWNSTETQFSRVDQKYPAYTLIATVTPQPDPKDAGAPTPVFTALLMTLLRLEDEGTDVVITINVPHIKGAYDEDEVDLEMGRQGKLIGDAVEFAAEIWKTFKVRDWSLFNGEAEEEERPRR